jgi:hypothetical protein
MTDAKLAPSHLAQTQVNWRRRVLVIALTSFIFLTILICELRQIVTFEKLFVLVFCSFAFGLV